MSKRKAEGKVVDDQSLEAKLAAVVADHFPRISNVAEILAGSDVKEVEAHSQDVFDALKAQAVVLGGYLGQVISIAPDLYQDTLSMLATTVHRSAVHHHKISMELAQAELQAEAEAATQPKN